MRLSDEKWKKLDHKAKRTIQLCVSDSILLNVSGEATTKDLWDMLETLYQSKSLANNLFLRKKVYNLRMKDGDSVTEHLNALILSGRSRSPRKLVKVVCWKCKKEGHYKRGCKSKAHDKGKGFDDAPSAESKTTSNEGGDVYLVSSSTHVDHETLLIDSGASFHFTPHREWFCEYEKYDGGDAFLGDEKKAKIVGRRKVKLKLQVGSVRTLLGVLHIPTSATNLISVSKLDDAGVKTVFDKDTCKMVHGALVLMQGVQTGTLYKLEGSTVLGGCKNFVVPKSGAENQVVSREKTMLWHQRLRHIGEKGI
eukprot:PITA_33579